MSKNLIQRIAVAVVAIPTILWISYQGGLWLAGMVTLFALVGIVEFLLGEGIRPKEFLFWLALCSVLAIVSGSTTLAGTLARSTYLFETLGLGVFGFRVFFSSLGVVNFFLISAMVLAIGREEPAALFERHARAFWGVFYVGTLYPVVFSISELGVRSLSISGGDLLLFLFALLWVGDTAAMFGGKATGTIKLAPTVSPNKTVEGFVCGIVGAIVIGVIMYYWKLSDLGMVHVLVLSIGCSVFGQLGDLVESMWKRSRGIKDSSALIPGHGGVLDRFDSLLFAAPFMYAYLMFVM